MRTMSVGTSGAGGSGVVEGESRAGSRAERDLDATYEEMQDLSWQADANCVGVDPDIFFPERGASTKEAKSICTACKVRENCLEYALDNGEKFGIWGGTSERERRRLRRARAAARQAKQAASGRRVAV